MSEEEIKDYLVSFVEQVQVQMITDENYYNKAVEDLTKKGLLPKLDKLEQAKREAKKIINL